MSNLSRKLSSELHVIPAKVASNFVLARDKDWDRDLEMFREWDELIFSRFQKTLTRPRQDNV